jgi:hypothetical protein
MNNMLVTIVPKSDQLNADDLIGRNLTIEVESVTITPGTEQPVAIHFAGDGGKPYKPCKSMCRILVQTWGPDANQYVGRGMTLYRDPTVKWGGMDVGGIRISHLSHLESAMTMALTATKQTRKPFTVKPLVSEQDKPKATLADWIATGLPALLIPCPSAEAIAEVMAGKMYQAALAKATDAQKAEMQTQVDAAKERLSAPPDPDLTLATTLKSKVESATKDAEIVTLAKESKPKMKEWETGRPDLFRLVDEAIVERRRALGDLQGGLG